MARLAVRDGGEDDMRILVVDAFAADQPGKALLDRGVARLAERGHEIDHVDLVATGFPPFMTEDERRRYHDADNLSCPHVEASVAMARSAEAVLFGYPTTMFTVPAQLKGWLERTMVPGVAFVFDAKQRVRPGLVSVRRVGAITTTPHSRSSMRSTGDNGRRTLMRSFRANCGPRCRRSFVSIHDADLAADPDAATARVDRSLSRW